MTNTMKKYINKPAYSKERMENARKNSNYYSLVSEEFKGMPTAERVKKLALRHSDNGRCWWIYNHIMNSYWRK